jgi:hypothetical protein
MKFTPEERAEWVRAFRALADALESGHMPLQEAQVIQALAERHGVMGAEDLKAILSVYCAELN